MKIRILLLDNSEPNNPPHCDPDFNIVQENWMIIYSIIEDVKVRNLRFFSLYILYSVNYTIPYVIESYEVLKNLAITKLIFTLIKANKITRALLKNLGICIIIRYFLLINFALSNQILNLDYSLSLMSLGLKCLWYYCL
jgi:hypothetical protein